jgi:2-phospho-L-lactate guanylyltransferase
MSLTAIVPFKPLNPKTRLSCVLSLEEREAFAEQMLSDIINALREAGCTPTILSTHSCEFHDPEDFRDSEVFVDSGGLNEALNRMLARTRGPVLIIMADLPLVTPEAVTKMLQSRWDVVIAPGRGGGTNAILIRDPSRFRVNYYGASYLKHRRIALEQGLSCEVVDSFRLHTDVDEREDLVELLIHGTGRSRVFLEELGFSLSVEKGRVGVERNPPLGSR